MIGCFLKTAVRKMNQSAFKGVELKDVTGFFEKFAPKSIAEPWDNTGLLIEPTVPQLLKKILLTIDLTEDVVSEAVDLNVGLIISYHPPIFTPLKEINTKSWKGRVIATCLENKIAVYSPHTSLDKVSGGLNSWLISPFETENVIPIDKSDSEIGAGRYGQIPKGISIAKAIEKVKKLTCLNYVNVALGRGATLDTLVYDVAVCAGSGGSVLLNKKADLYVTGEMSHHSLLDAIHNGTSVILCNHSNSERGYLNEFQKKLMEITKFDAEIIVSKKDKDPMQIM